MSLPFASECFVMEPRDLAQSDRTRDCGDVLPLFVPLQDFPRGLAQLAIKPPVPESPNLKLLNFKKPPPSRRIAMAWRKSSAMGGFLHQVADILRDLPPDLLKPPADAVSAPTVKARKRA